MQLLPDFKVPVIGSTKLDYRPLVQCNQHHHRISYYSKMTDKNAFASAKSTSMVAENPKDNANEMWLMEIAQFPAHNVSHDSYAGNSSIRLLAEVIVSPSSLILIFLLF